MTNTINNPLLNAISNRIELINSLTNTTNTISTNTATNISIQAFFQGLKDNITLNHLLFSIGTIVILMLIRFVILKIVWKNTDEANIRYRWRKTSGYVMLGIAIIVISQIWIKQFNSFLTYLGLVSAGIAIALKDFVLNFLGWIFIVSAKPFVVGDRIELNKLTGDVIDINTFSFTLLEIGNWVDADQSTGRIVYVPNGKIFNTSIANYNKAFHYIWNEIPVLITFHSDWKRAKQLLENIAKKDSKDFIKTAEQKIKEASRQFMIYYNTLEPAVYIETKHSGVQLTLRYLCHHKKRRTTSNKIWIDILNAFSKEKNIEFAYQTITLDEAKKVK